MYLQLFMSRQVLQIQYYIFMIYIRLLLKITKVICAEVDSILFKVKVLGEEDKK